MYLYQKRVSKGGRGERGREGGGGGRRGRGGGGGGRGQSVTWIGGRVGALCK